MYKSVIAIRFNDPLANEPLLWGHTFCISKVAFQEGGLSSGVEINILMFRFTLSSGLSRGGVLS